MGAPTCKVNGAGPAENGIVYINLTDLAGSFTERWFQAIDSQKKEMLSVALAALTSDHAVTAALGGSDDYSPINRLYLLRPGFFSPK